MNLNDMIGGWFIGDFEPSVIRTKDFEVAIKKYKAGQKDSAHVHKVATEITVIAEGRVKINSVEYPSGSIVEIKPNEPSDFEVLEDTITVVVKIPSVSGDKYIL